MAFRTKYYLDIEMKENEMSRASVLTGKGNACFYDGKSEGKKQPWTHSRSWEDNIQMDYKEWMDGGGQTWS